MSIKLWLSPIFKPNLLKTLTYCLYLKTMHSNVNKYTFQLCTHVCYQGNHTVKCPQQRLFLGKPQK